MFNFLYGIWRRRRADDQDEISGFRGQASVTISAPTISATGTAVLEGTASVSIGAPAIEASSGGSQFTGVAEVSVSAPIIRLRGATSSHLDTSQLASPGVPGGGVTLGGGRIKRDVIFHESPISRAMLRTIQDECMIICGDIVEAEEMAIRQFRGQPQEELSGQY